MTGSAGGGERPRVVPTVLEEIEVEIEKLVAGGDGLARCEGFPVFVPRAVPGDRLRIRVTETHANFGRGEILAVVEPGEGRREPPCEYFGRCGGCDLQQIEDDLQARLKAEAVLETLSRIGKIRPPHEVEIVTGDSWGYRLRARLRVAGEGDRPAVGYRARRSHELVAVSSCPILVPELEELVRRLPGRLVAGEPPHRLDVAAGDGGELTTAPVVEGLPSGPVQRRIGGLDYSYDARCFFQGHAQLLPRLVASVVGDAEGRLAYDLYAGVGLFALQLAARYERVVAVEGDRIAARYCRMNARAARCANLEVDATALESWIPRLERDADRVVVDPPRAGLSLQVLGTLIERRPRHLTYVSCHAAALARDLARLKSTYELTRLVLLDLFPQTGHMEAVVHLRRR